MLTISFIIFSAVCSAVMDVLMFHYEQSIFSIHDNPKYWNPKISWKNKYVDWDNGNKTRKKWLGIFNIHPAFTDAWHLQKSSMIVYLVLAIVFYKPIFNIFFDIFLFGAIWNITFSIFYKKLFRI